MLNIAVIMILSFFYAQLLIQYLWTTPALATAWAKAASRDAEDNHFDHYCDHPQHHQSDYHCHWTHGSREPAQRLWCRRPLNNSSDGGETGTGTRLKSSDQDCDRQDDQYKDDHDHRGGHDDNMMKIMVAINMKMIKMVMIIVINTKTATITETLPMPLLAPLPTWTMWSV